MLRDLAIRNYPLILALSASTGGMLLVWIAHREGVAIRRILAFQAILTVFALLGGRLYLLVSQAGFAWSWSELLRPGYRQPGAIAGLVIGLPVARALALPRLSLARLADWLAQTACFGIVGIRVGCFLVGCCFGTVCDLPWAVRFPPGSEASHLHARAELVGSAAQQSLPVHPLQLYFLTVALLLGIFLLWFRKRQTFAGQAFLIFVAVHEGAKFALEPLRGLDAGQTYYLLESSLFLSATAAVLLAARTFAIRPETQDPAV